MARHPRPTPGKIARSVGRLLSALLLIALALALAPRAAAALAPDGLRAAWEQARSRGAYSFNAAITQRSVPLAEVANVGRAESVDRLQLAGTADPRAERLSFTIAAPDAAVPALNLGPQGAQAIEVEVEGGVARARQGGGPWQQIDDLSAAYAPGGDFFAVLAAARDVRPLDPAEAAGREARRYGFTVDGPAFAAAVRDQAERRMAARAELAPGARLDLPALYRELRGEGELWVGPDGLPLRQILRLSFPPAEGSQVSAEVTVDFANFAAPAAAPLNPVALLDALAGLARAALPVLIGLALMAGLILYARSRRLHVAVAMLMALLVPLSPLGQAAATAAAAERRAPAEAARAERQAFAEQRQAVAQTFSDPQPTATPEALQLIESDPGKDSDGDGASDVQERLLGTNPLAPDSAPGAPLASTTADSDGDNLTDYQEQLLGTARFRADTDGDGLPDGAEIRGVASGGTAYALDPQQPDTNRDGIGDGQECELFAALACADTDRDGVPDAFERDNDNDGVSDNLDLSPGQRLSQSFDGRRPLELTLTGLQPGALTYVEFQVRTSDPARLRQAYNVFDWPMGDDKGQLRDVDGATFSGATGDLKLVPMLEIVASDGRSTLPDQAVLSRYGIAVQKGSADGARQTIYVPLQLASDPQTGAPAALYGKMLYQVGSAGWARAQQVRLVWAVQALVDTCNRQGDDGTCAEYAYNQPQVVQTYEDTWSLAGMAVRENRGVDMATIYADPAAGAATNNDAPLAALADGIDTAFLTARDCDSWSQATGCVGDGQRDLSVAELARRFNQSTNGAPSSTAIWGLPDIFAVSTRSYPDLDAALITTASTSTPALLDAAFPKDGSAAPTLLFVREERFRAANLATLNTPGSQLRLSGSRLSVDLNRDGGTPLQTIGGMSWAPFRYQGGAWGAFPIEEYWGELRSRTASQFESGDTPRVSAGKELVAQIYYLQLYKGMSAHLSIGNAILTDRELVQSDEQLEFARGFVDLSREQLVRIVNNVVLYQVAGKVQLQDYLGGVALRTTGGGTLKDIGVENELSGLRNAFRDVWDGPTKGARLSGAFAIGLFAAELAGTALLIAGAVTDNPRLTLAGSVIMLAVLTVATITGPVLAIKSAVQTASQTIGKSAAIKAVLSGQGEITGAAKAAAVVGLVLSIGIAWGVFLYQVIADGLKPGTIAFNTALAFAISSTVVAVLSFVLSLTVVGTIILAVIGIVDLLLQVICLAGARGACFSLVGKYTELLARLIYSGDLLIDSERDDMVETGTLSVSLRDTRLGLRAGNGLAFSIGTRYTLVHKQPAAGSGAIYKSEFWTTSALRRATLVANLAESEQAPSAAASQMTDRWLDLGKLGEAKYSDFGVITTVPIYAVRTGNEEARSSYRDLSAGLNRSFPLVFNLGYALPGYDCWVGVCDFNTVTGSSSNDLGAGVVFDVFPATIDEFVGMAWDATLPAPRDRDGDGLTAAAYGGNDPDDTKWDTDGDGLADATELEKRAGGPANGGAAIDPLKADTDGDGVGDADEVLLGSNPARADTDGDGIADADERAGYQISLGGLSVRVTSDPRAADTDGDGMSDLAERNLYNLDPASYPFSPRAPNQSPLALSAALGDSDGVVRPGATVVYSATLANRAATSLYTRGTLQVSFPAPLGAPALATPFDLLSGATSVLTRTLAVPGGAGSKVAVIGGSASAQLFTPAPANQPLGALATAQNTTLTIDNDAPTVALAGIGFVAAGRATVIGGSAADPTSAVARVEVSVNGGPWQRARGAESWSLAWDVPAGEGPATIAVRAADVVENQGPPRSFTVYADGTAPTVSVPAGTPMLGAGKVADGRFAVSLSGGASDPRSGGNSSGVGAVEVLVTPNSSGWQRAAVGPDGAWSIVYPLSLVDADNRVIADPSGSYSYQVRATDKVGNVTAEAGYARGAFLFDAAPPSSTLDGLESFQRIDWRNSLRGTAAEQGAVRSGVAGLEISYTPAELTAPLSSAAAFLALDEGVGARRFENVTAALTPATCPPGGCPTSGQPGKFGLAPRFGGNQYLEIPRLDAPETGYTLSLWFNTTCPDCGLFSVVEGQLGAVASDRNIYLSNGNVCADVRNLAQVETICTSGVSYADGQWHSLAHVIGAATRHQLWLDGTLAASGARTESTLSAQTGIVLGYAPPARTRYLTGFIDEVRIFRQAFGARQIQGLTQSWQPVAITPGDSVSWAANLPAGLEGLYQIDLRAFDGRGNRDERREGWGKWRGEIDTAAPRASLTVNFSGSGQSLNTEYRIRAEDLNLTRSGFVSPCALDKARLTYNSDPWATRGRNTGRLQVIELTCTKPGYPAQVPLVRACDLTGLCTTTLPSTEKIYWGSMVTGDGRVYQANARDGSAQRTIYGSTAANRRIWDLDLDRTRGLVFIVDDSRTIWRMGLDGGSPRQLTPFNNQANIEQIALNPSAGKIYWVQYSTTGPFPVTRGAIWRANMDGSAREFLFDINLAYQPGTTNALTVDAQTGKLYYYEPAADDTGGTYKGAIYRANFDGTDRELVRNLAPSGSNPGRSLRDMTIDPVGRTLYWIDSARDAGVDGMALWRMNLDNLGAGPTQLAKVANTWSLGLALDSQRTRLFWGGTNAFLNQSSADIRSAYVTPQGLQPQPTIPSRPMRAISTVNLPGPTTVDRDGGDVKIVVVDDIQPSPLPIPQVVSPGACANGLTRSFNVPDDMLLTNVRVGLNITHPDRRDLSVTLKAPSSSTLYPIYTGVNSTNPPGRNLDVLIDRFALNSPASSAIDDDVGPPFFDREMMPHTTLSDLTSRSPNARGIWELSICDPLSPALTGAYNRAQLILTLKPKPPATAAAPAAAGASSAAASPEAAAVAAALATLNATGPVTEVVPLDYLPPLVHSAVLTPSNSPIVTALAPIAIQGGAYAQASLKSLCLTVNGAAVYTPSWARNAVTDTTWSFSWTPPGAGVYVLDTVATDWNDVAQSATQPVTLTVATGAPTLAIDGGATLTADGLLRVTGTINADAQAQVEVFAFGTRGYVPAQRSGNSWSFAWRPAGLPDNQTLSVFAQVTDGAGRSASASRDLTVDVKEPGPFALTLSVQLPDSSWAPLEAGQVVSRAAPRLAIEWDAAADGSPTVSYFAGWTTDPNAAAAALTPIAAGQRRHEQIAGDRQALYARVIARDGSGNERAFTVGPVYVDAPETPDLSAELAYGGWTQSGATLIGVDNAASLLAPDGGPTAAPQRLFATWDAQALRLRWSGAAWDGDGDLFVYLDAAGGGATTAHNPYGGAETVRLPAGMAADYAVWVRGAGDGELLRWDGAAWVSAGALSAAELRFAGEAAPPATDIRLAFGRIGVGSPAATPLKLLAFAVPEGALRPWATIPDRQPLSAGPAVAPSAAGRPLGDVPLRLFHSFPSLGPGVRPGGPLAPGSHLDLSLSADSPGAAAAYLGDSLFDLLAPGAALPDGVELPAADGARPLRDGESVVFTLRYANRGDQPARGVRLSLAAEGGLQVTSSATVDLGDIAAGASGEVQITAAAWAGGGPTGALRIEVADTLHGPFEWLWSRHSVDSAPPTGLTIVDDGAYVRPGRNVAAGEVVDAAGVRLVELEVQPQPAGATQRAGCLDGDPTDGLWSCAWDAADLGGVSEVRLRARATDLNGAVGPWTDWVTRPVDLAPPSVALSAATEQALADGYLSAAELGVEGTIADNRRALGVTLCLDGQQPGACPGVPADAGGVWRADLRGVATADGRAAVLRVVGEDEAGNRSAALERSFTLDTVAPALTLQQAGGARLDRALPMIGGAVADGGGVRAVAVRVTTPDGASRWVSATVTGSTWQLTLPAAGDGSYGVTVEAVDVAGNRAAVGPTEVIVGAGPGDVRRVYLPLLRR
jgi:hypothetical protein